jgi:hypothetical protein
LNNPVSDPPRQARFKRWVLVTGVGLSVLFALSGVGVWTLQQRSLAQQRTLIDHGRETSAVLIGRRIRDGYRRTFYIVRYGFVVNGRRYSREVASRVLYDSFPRPPRVTATYWVSDPSVSQLGTRAALEEQWQAGTKSIWFVPLVTAGLFILLAYYRRGLRRHLHLARHGILRWGISAGSRRFGRVYRASVLLDGSGGTQVRKFWVNQTFATNHGVHKPVALLMDPNDSESMVPYEQVAATITINGTRDWPLRNQHTADNPGAHHDTGAIR